MRFAVTLRRALPLGAVASLFVFVALAIDVSDDRGWIADVDRDFAELAHDGVDDRPPAIEASKTGTRLGDTMTLFVVVSLLTVAALARGRARLAVIVVVTAISGALLNHAVKELVDRARPQFADPVAVGHGPSFPSGHAMNSMIAYGSVVLVVWILHRRFAMIAAVVSAIVVAVVGVTRVTLGVHYVSDVVGGWLLGAVWLALAVVVLGDCRTRQFARATE
ncbi:MAG TPA: phosphatase PAP2 family protein [Acidimicrobiia bacterium]|nr:phosphatase PAP2 family protein [Acidimicrobiia bacterium]